MDFWIPVLVIFVSAVLGAIVKMRARDSCLKAFQHCCLGHWL